MSTTDLAAIANRVWEKVPGCRPTQLLAIEFDQGNVAFQAAWNCTDATHAACWYNVGWSEMPAAELLIIGACHRARPGFYYRQSLHPDSGEWFWVVYDAYDGPNSKPIASHKSQAAAALLAVEAVAAQLQGGE